MAISELEKRRIIRAARDSIRPLARTTDWETDRLERDSLAATDKRFAGAGDIAIRACESIKRVSDYIDQQQAHPATLAEMRAIERRLTECFLYALERYVGR